MIGFFLFFNVVYYSFNCSNDMMTDILPLYYYFYLLKFTCEPKKLEVGLEGRKAGY